VRYYDMGKILGLGSEDMPIIGYASVSSHDQKNDLVRQQDCSKFSARLYGSRCPKTKQLLADLRGEESKEEEIVTKSMPIPEGRVGALIESMQETQFKGMLLYAELLKKRKGRKCCWLIKSRSTRLRSSGSTLSARRVPRASPGIGRWPNGSVKTRPVSGRLKSHCVGS
jgi:hypothetical protein